MASGGMGDVLSGVIGSLVAQGLELDYALNLATALHAFAADLAAKQNGERGLCATDLISVIRQVLNKQGSAQ
jgi:NAD(P)H-hydrate epimerase